MRILLFLALLLTLVVVTASAQVAPAPRMLQFQGRLARPDGTPIADGTYSITFSLYEVTEGGSPKWSQTHDSVTVRNGVFAALLGLFPTDTFYANLWLEIKIGNNPPLAPRERLVPVAYALVANAVADNSVGTNQLTSNAVTTPKIAAGAITSAKIANDAASLRLVSGELLQINQGKLGIGTSAPAHLLDVNGRMQVRDGVIQRGGSPITATSDLGLYSLHSGNWMRFVTNNAPIRFFSDGGAIDGIGLFANLTIAANGNVGIGESSPGSRLTIRYGNMDVLDASADLNARLGYDLNGGYLNLYNSNNSRYVTASYLSARPEGGYVGVDDNSGSFKARMFVDTSGRGVFAGDIKNFCVPNPDDPGSDIWYASLEGPEAAMYVRGTATLVHGRATIAFPRHFQSMATEDNLTVQLTPRSAASKGLAVVNQDARGFTVAELFEGQGNYTFHWEAKCIRRGYENYQPVRPWDEALPGGVNRQDAWQKRLRDLQNPLQSPQARSTRLQARQAEKRAPTARK